MTITAQLPPISLAAASPALRALAQAAGQTVEARVMGQLANGMTHIQLGPQNLAIALPTPQTPGTVLSLAVQQSQGQLRLTILAARPPGTAPSGPATPPPSATTPAAATVELSAAALSARSVAPQPAVPAASVPPGTVAPPAGPRGATRPGQPSAVATAPGGAATPAGAAASTVAPAAPSVAPAAAAPIPAAAPPGPAAPAAGVTPAPPASAGPVAPGAAAATPSTAPVTAAPATAAPVAPTVPPANVSGSLRPIMPYAGALPAAGPGPAPLGNSAAVALPPVQQVAAAAAVGQHDPATARAAAAPLAPAAPAGAPPTAPPATSPQQALAQMVQQALPRQNSVLALTVALTSALGRAGLPEPVAKAAQQVLARQTVLDGKIDSASLKTALRDSGVFHEALLAGGRPGAAAGDMKAALLGLQRELGRWLGPQGAVERVAQIPPPLRGLTPRSRVRELPPTELPGDLREAGKVLQERTEHALGRLRLHQNASLPDSTPRADTNWSMDLPVIVHGQPTLLQMQIQRDAEDETTRPEDRGWQVRFAVQIGDHGEVGAQISMRGKTTGILLWADDPTTAAALNVALGELREDLGAVGLVSGALVVRAGAPLDESPPPSDHVVDAVR